MRSYLSSNFEIGFDGAGRTKPFSGDIIPDADPKIDERENGRARDI